MKPGDWTEALENILPAIDKDGIPHCTRETCPAFSIYSMKCRIVGGPPEAICEPHMAKVAGSNLLTDNEKLKRRVANLESELARAPTVRAAAAVATRVEDRVAIRRTCPACVGWGRAARSTCDRCGGSGEIGAGGDPEPELAAPVIAAAFRCGRCRDTGLIGVGPFYQPIYCGDCDARNNRHTI